LVRHEHQAATHLAFPLLAGIRIALVALLR
jgi:hypothetical protein